MIEKEEIGDFDENKLIINYIINRVTGREGISYSCIFLLSGNAPF